MSPVPLCHLCPYVTCALMSHVPLIQDVLCCELNIFMILEMAFKNQPKFNIHINPFSAYTLVVKMRIHAYGTYW
jgi:hypothetical protein